MQLVVSSEVIAEYLEIFGEVLGLSSDTLEAWRKRFEEDKRTSLVSLGKRYDASRDPDDNVMLATALAGKADYLITNDKDLLDLPDKFKKSVSFTICSPSAFLRQTQRKT